MRFMKYCIYFTILITLVFISGSCSDNGSGIFYQIENEEPIVDSNLPNELNVRTISKAGDNYYLAGGKFMEKPAGTSIDWTNIDLPDTSANWYVTGAAALGTVVLVEILDNDADTDPFLKYLYLYDSTGKKWSSSAVATTTFNNEQFYCLLEEAGAVYLQSIEGDVEETSRIFHLYEITGPDVATSSITLSEITAMYDGAGTNVIAASDIPSQPFLDLANDGTNLWILTGNRVLNSSSITFDQPDIASGYNRFHRNIYYWSDPDNAGLYLSNYTQHDYAQIYRLTSSGWETIDTGLYQLQGFAEVNFGESNILLVGSETGYYEFDPDDDGDGGEFISASATIPSDDNEDTFENADLDDNVFTGFFIDDLGGDGEDEVFYGMVSNFGLWYNEEGEWKLF